MNENPYASPTEIPESVVEEMKAEERFRDGSVWLTWGIVWILCSSLLMNILFCFILLLALKTLVPSLPPAQGWEDRLTLFIYTGVGSFIITQFMGLVCCCFCPCRLVKRGKLYVIGSYMLAIVAVILPCFAPVIPVNPDPIYPLEFYVMINLGLGGLAASFLLWQFFLLRLAHRLNSVSGKRLARGAMFLFCVVAAGVIAHINMDITGRDTELDAKHKLLVFPVLAYGVTYSLLLAALWRGLRNISNSRERSEAQ